MVKNLCILMEDYLKIIKYIFLEAYEVEVLQIYLERLVTLIFSNSNFKCIFHFNNRIPNKYKNINYWFIGGSISLILKFLKSTSSA